MSKAIIDKADIACMVMPVDKADSESIAGYADQVGMAPTHVMDVYKIRSGRFRGVRIWYYYNLGNGYRKDLFITDGDNNILTFEPYEIVEELSSNAEVLSTEKLERILEIDIKIERDEEF